MYKDKQSLLTHIEAEEEANNSLEYDRQKIPEIIFYRKIIQKYFPELKFQDPLDDSNKLDIRDTCDCCCGNCGACDSKDCVIKEVYTQD